MKLRRLPFLVITSFVSIAMWSPTIASANTSGSGHLFFGLAKATTTVNLVSGAGSTQFDGVALPIGRFSATTNATFASNGTTFTSSGTGTIFSATGEMFFNTSTTGTLNGTDETATTTDTIVNGTGRYSGAGGTLTIFSKSTSSTTDGSTETFAVNTLWLGNIRY